MAFSLSELVSAVFNGAPTPELTEKYTAQITALISLYICAVAVFLVWLYIRAVKKRADLTEERRLFKVWIAWSSIYAILMITAFVLYFLVSVS
jgi:large-conductance mechanosensitive channel